MPRAADGTAYEVAGDAGTPAVVLIHGLGLNRHAWQWQRPAIARRYRAVAFDLYGHGESPAPPEKPSLGLFSDQLVRLMDEIGVERGGIVGFSLGGMIARRFAMDHPGRIAALVVLNSPHRRTPEAQAAILKRVAAARVDGPAATVEAALERWFTPGFRRANPELMDQVRSWVVANDPAVYHTVYRVLAEGIEEIVAPEPAITAPTLVVTADEDFGNGPEMSRAIAAEIPGAEAMVLPGLRHMALAEDPDAVTQPLLRFLDHHLEKAP